MFCGFGAILGLALAGYALFSAKGSAIGAMPPEVLALVNQRPILRSDFLAQTQTETGQAFAETTAAQRQKVLREMIDEELLVQRGLDVDLAASDPDVRSALVAGVDLQVDADVLARQPTEAELRDYFDSHKAKYAAQGVMQLRDLIVPDTAGPPAAIVAALRQSGSADTVIRQFGLADSGAIDQRENYDFAVAARLGETLYAAAATLAAGQVSDPLAVGGKTHILVMLGRRAPPPVDFAAARDAVWQDVQREAREHVEQANLAYLRGMAVRFCCCWPHCSSALSPRSPIPRARAMRIGGSSAMSCISPSRCPNRRRSVSAVPTARCPPMIPSGNIWRHICRPHRPAAIARRRAYRWRRPQRPASGASRSASAVRITRRSG
jgi:parvulin-like peptidyl-prolyl isomerase